MHMHLPGLGQNVPYLLIAKGHIPIGLYISGILGGIFNKSRRENEQNEREKGKEGKDV